PRPDLALLRAATPRHERQHVLAVADEHERLHDLLEPAADRPRRLLCRRRPGRKLLDRRVDGGDAQKRRNALDGFRERVQTATRCSYASKARVTATPRSMSAPSSVSDSSTAASAAAMSKTSNQPMWPMRKILPFRPPWPGARVSPCRSRR